MHISNLKTYCDLVETKSFSKAARLNGVTQSAVSQQLKSMETYFDMLIIDRSQKKFRLTPQGGKLYSSFKDIVRLYEKLECELQEMSNVVSGTIHVSTVNSIGLHELPNHLKSFIKEFPTVNVRVEYRRSNLVYDDILQGSIDLGLVAFPLKRKELTVIPFAEDQLVLAVHPENPLAKRKSVKLKDLHGMDFIGFERDIPTRQATDKLLRQASVEVEMVMEFDNVETVKRAIEINAGIAILPASTIGNEKLQKELKEIPLIGSNFKRPLAVIHRKDKILNPAMRSFIDLLKNGN
ncbi:MAG: LysR family transcriptional regulator [Opitutales bacterium]